LQQIRNIILILVKFKRKIVFLCNKRNILPMKNEEMGILMQERRLKLALKQEDVSEMIGISTKTIQNIENGKANPSLKTLQKLSAILGLELIMQIKNTAE
jgi:DNA-binding XRE family transcriptional regulator